MATLPSNALRDNLSMPGHEIEQRLQSVIMNQEAI